MDQDPTWYGGRPRPRPHCVRWNPAPPHRKGHSSPHFRDLRTWGPSSPKERSTASPTFGPWLLWPNGWMDQDTTWYGDRSRPRRHCVLCGTSSPTKRGTEDSTFAVYGRMQATDSEVRKPRPMSIVAKRSPISATTDHLFQVVMVRMSMFQLLKWRPCSRAVVTSVCNTAREHGCHFWHQRVSRQAASVT